ncbi:hypothetical protein DEU56DRAFT_970914 [Suillus clintonianus]|uniref:uncharacterized protein n=1 Tax=Suillus clintonianus TaxID=1904413 RepID=UPI001B86F1F7|nr:uncharacterized protein DEU56DRAFT_970914 [Suillus clintonianus]KAG2149189.1 hypothetical protein DEU56DRAFT_970914 [Suillus clintonianus]
MLYEFVNRHVSRRSVARVVSTFLCVLIVTIRPFSQLGGSSAFLALSLKELVFSVQEDLAQQLEITVINITGALAGIGVSTFAKYLATIPQEGSVTSRLVPAIFLVTISFFAGWAKSRLPRLHLSARISCFVSIWLLTDNIGVSSAVLSDSGSFIWITATAASVCLFSSVSILHWSSTHLIEEVASTLRILHRCLSVCMDNPFTCPSSQQIADLKDLHVELVHRSVILNEMHYQAAFELRIGRVNVKSLKPLLGIVEHLRRELSWGMIPRSVQNNWPSKSHSASSPSFEASAIELGKTIMSSIKAVEDLVIGAYTHASLRSKPLHEERDAVIAAAISLNLAWYTAKSELCNTIRTLSEKSGSPSGSIIPLHLHHQCLFATSLLQMAYDTSHILHVAQNIAAHHEASRLRFWLPQLTWQWLGVAPRTFIMEDYGAPIAHDAFEAPDTTLSDEEVRQGIAFVDRQDESKSREVSYAHAIKRIFAGPHLSLKAFRSLSSAPQRLWNYPVLLRLRLGTSKIIRNMQHSTHLQHAMKNAIGVAMLSFPAFLPSNSAGYLWYRWIHGQWMSISYVWVLEINTGASWRVGYLRLSGTILGAIYACITWAICGRNSIGIVAMVTLFDVPITWIVTKSRMPSLGVVASVTLPPIVLSQYLTPDSGLSVQNLAWMRASTIALGIIAALATNSLVFPRYTRVLFLNQISRTLSLLSQLYLLLGQGMFRNIYAFTPHDKQETLKLELQIRNALHQSSSLLTTMNDELSLVPKPMRHYREVVLKIQKILDLMTGLRKIRENIPRKETVASVLKERKEFISCICLSLFASQHVFRARQPLPQFLPSARQALETLESQLEASMRQSIDVDASVNGISLAYSIAEREVMRDMVDTIEGLLELCRQLFGTSAWLTHTWPEMSAHNADEGPGMPGEGWFSTVGRT